MKLTPFEFLALLLDDGIIDRRHRKRLTRIEKSVGFESVTLSSSFDFAAAPTIDRVTGVGKGLLRVSGAKYSATRS